MGTSDQLSMQSQEAVLASLPAQHKANSKSALGRSLWTAGGILGGMAALSLAPASILPVAMFAATAVTLIAGTKLLGNASRALSLLGVKAGVAGDKFVPKLKKKAGNALKRTTFFNKVSNIAFFGILGTWVLGSAVATAPIAAVVAPIALVTMLGSWAASEWTKGTAEGTRPTAKLVYERQVAEGVIAPAEKILPPGAALQQSAPQKSMSRSILDMFRRKASGEKPKEPAKKLVNTPKLKPPGM